MYAVDYFVAAIRGRLPGQTFGVQKIKIGSRACLRGLSSVDMGEDFSAETGLWLETIFVTTTRFFVSLNVEERSALMRFVERRLNLSKSYNGSNP
jgi:hypothetical protein